MPDNRQTLILKSDLNELTKIEGFIDTLVELSGANEETAASIMLLLSEAATNGILHGNKLNEDKIVTIESEFDDDNIILTVTDEGDGFDPNKVPDPLKEENLLKTSGRGVYLMKEYAHDVWYNSKGNQLKLTFKKA